MRGRLLGQRSEMLRAGDRRIGFKFNFTRNLNDRLSITAILEKSVFERLSAVQEHPAKHAVLFQGNPIATTISANKNDRRYRTRLHEVYSTKPEFRNSCRTTPKDVQRPSCK